MEQGGIHSFNRYNFDDLMTQLREKNIRSIADVEFAILESSGSLSVIEKLKDKNEEPQQGDITIPLILDGNIEEENLTRINKTNLWLRQELKKKGYRDVKKISFCSYENGKFFIDLQDEWTKDTLRLRVLFVHSLGEQITKPRDPFQLILFNKS